MMCYCITFRNYRLESIKFYQEDLPCQEVVTIFTLHIVQMNHPLDG